MNTTTKTTKTTAAELYAKVDAVSLDAVPVVCTERHVTRKAQAALARRLFAALKIKGISVTAPNYSMAQSVDVVLPREDVSDADFVHGGVNYTNHSYSDMPEDVPARAKSLRHYRAGQKVLAILLAAFPNSGDRSNSIEDHFDYKWSIN